MKNADRFRLQQAASVAIIVTLAVIGVCLAGEAEQVSVYPHDSTNWSGFVEYYPYHNPLYSKWDNDIIWAFYPSNDNARDRGWCRFDLRLIPDTVSIMGAELWYYIDFSAQDSEPPTEVRILTSDPLDASAQTIYTEAGSGILAAPVQNADTGWNSVALSPAGLDALQQRLSQDWIAVAWSYPGTHYILTSALGHRNVNCPYVAVTWQTVGVAGERSAPGVDRVTLDVNPNPTSGRTVAARWQTPVRATRTSPLHLSVHDAAGRCIGVWKPSPQTGVIPLDVSSLPSGVYLVRLSAGGLTATRKLVIHRR